MLPKGNSASGGWYVPQAPKAGPKILRPRFMVATTCGSGSLPARTRHLLWTPHALPSNTFRGQAFGIHTRGDILGAVAMALKHHIVTTLGAAMVNNLATEQSHRSISSKNKNPSRGQQPNGLIQNMTGVYGLAPFCQMANSYASEETEKRAGLLCCGTEIEPLCTCPTPRVTYVLDEESRPSRR